MNELKSAWEYPDPILSITTHSGPIDRWTYSPDFQDCNPPVLLGAETLYMSGSRRCDRANLIDAVGQPSVWCHCHHTFSYSDENNPTADMQFVGGWSHIRTYPHRGAVYQWNQAHPLNRYCSVPQNAAPVSAPQQYTNEEIASFEKEQHVTVPAFLREIYQKGQGASSLWKDDKGNPYELQDILYLTNPAKDPNALSAAAVMKLWPTLEVGKTPNASPLFWGEDACGNLFLVCQGSDTVYFYDHEEDTYTPVSQV